MEPLQGAGVPLLASPGGPRLHLSKAFGWPRGPEAFYEVWGGETSQSKHQNSPLEKSPTLQHSSAPACQATENPPHGDHCCERRCHSVFAAQRSQSVLRRGAKISSRMGKRRKKQKLSHAPSARGGAAAKVQQQKRGGRAAAAAAAAAREPRAAVASGTTGGGQRKNKQHGRGGGGVAASAAEPTIPFAPEEAILLVGEGDLSFAACLVEHHGCTRVTATVLEADRASSELKYPAMGANVAKVEEGGGGGGGGEGGAGEGCRVLYGVDARKMGPWVRKNKKPWPSAAGAAAAAAAKTATGGDREARQPIGAMDRIIFNFPHVGGKTTDVNRQVRLNQELLVDFFGRALLSLAPGGSIVVTLFEGEPYTLWNIRDLGRHAGLQVERSFRFRFDAYPGYHHVRTFGVVRNKDGEIGGGWKGEERAARSYVFVRKDDVPRITDRPNTKRKRGSQAGQVSEDSDED
jgi:25S rRNA (uracil2634-N3)-methyltransferase